MDKKWLIISKYAKTQGVTVQAIYNRIGKKLISEDRIRKNESGRIEIREA